MLFSDAAGLDPYTPLLNIGAVGIFVILSLIGVVWYKPAVVIILDQLRAVTAQRDRLIDQLNNEVLPVLQDVNQKVIPVLARAAERDDKLDQAAAELRLAGQELARLTAEVRRLGGG